MYTQIILLSVLLPTALSQVHADMTFGDQNNRFDLSALIQDGIFDDWGKMEDGDRRKEYRRSNVAANSEVDELTSKLFNILKRYKKPEKSGPELTDSRQYGKVLSYLHNRPEDERRSGAVDKEVLLHHAAPIVMRIRGVLVPDH